MSASPAFAPCLPAGLAAAPRREPVPVLEVLATGTVGGAQQHVVSLVRALDRQRFQPHVVSLSDGAAIRRTEAQGTPVTILRDRDDAAATASLADLIAELAPAVVHDHMYRAEVVGTLAVRRAVTMGAPRPFVISTVHSSRVRSAADRALLARLTPDIDRLIAVSRSIAAKIEREGRRSSPVEMIPNGVELGAPDHDAAARVRRELGVPASAPLVGVVARMEPEKGHPTLLEAWPQVLRHVSDARLVIVGEGSRQAALQRHADRLGLLADPPAVVFTGRRDDVGPIVAALDVAVLPSYREAQGVSLLEAMAMARPIVASRVGGIPEFVEDGVSGLLVPPRDRTALAAALVRVLSDGVLAERLGWAAREVVRERYCLDVMVRRIEDLYEEGVAAQQALVTLRRRSA